MKFVLFVSVIAVLGVLAADGLEAESLTLEQAIAMARQQNHGLAAERDLAEAAAHGVRANRGAFMPTLDASGTFSGFSGDVFYARFVPGIPGAPTGGVDVGSFDSTQSVLFMLRQPLYAGGGHSARLQASRVDQSIAEGEVSRNEDVLVLEVTRAYLQLLLADRGLEVARNSTQRTEQNVKSVRDLVAEREALDVDVLAAETQLGDDQHSLLVAENDRKLAQFSLNRLLGRDPSSSIEPTDVLGSAREIASEEDTIARALADNPDIQQATLRVELADVGIKGARSHYRPKVRLDGAYNWVDNETLLEGNFWLTALNVSIPFFADLTAGRGEVAQAQAKKSAAESALEETIAGITLQARRASSNVAEARRAVEVAEQNRRYRQEKYRVTSSAFTESLATFDDLLDDHVDLAQAELAVYQAQYQARLAEAEVRRLLGER